MLSQPAHPDRFTLEALIGQGGACLVYRAQDELYDRVVAIKMPAAAPLQPSAKSILRLGREGRCLARLDHPNILRFHDGHPGEHGADPPFLVMEFVPGLSLDAWLERHGPVPPVVAMMIGLGIARALDEAHRAGIIHRDVKPANVLIDERHPGRLLLCDFGAAWMEDGLELTAQDEPVGTPAFMSPEQTRGGRVTAYADVFSLGGTLHELVTGELPFPGETREEVTLAIQRCQYEAPREGAKGLVPRPLALLLGRCLRAEPSERPTAAAVGAWLEQALALDELGDVERYLGPYFADPKGYAEHLSRFAMARDEEEDSEEGQRGRRGRRRWAMGVAAAMGMGALAAVGWMVWRVGSGDEAMRVVGRGPENEVRRRIEGMRTKDEVMRYAAEELERNPAAFDGVMAVLDGHHNQVHEDGIQEVLQKTSHLLLERMLAHMARHPERFSTESCAKVVSLRAITDLRHAAGTDARIVPALARLVEARLGEGTASVWKPLWGLKEIARLQPLPSVDYLMARVLEQAKRDGAAVHPGSVEAAATVLMLHGGELTAEALQAQIEQLPRNDMLRSGIETALLERRQRLILSP